MAKTIISNNQMNTLRKNYLGYKKMFQTISSIFKEISKIMNWKKAKYQDTCPIVVRLSPGNFTWFLGSPFLVPYPSASSTYFGLWSLSPQPRRTTVSAWILNSYVTLRKLHTGMELGESWSHFMYFFFSYELLSYIACFSRPAQFSHFEEAPILWLFTEEN